MMKLRRILLVLLIIVLIIVGVYVISLLVVRNSGYHQYPTSEELQPYSNPGSYEACRIPKYKLFLMSTEQLAQALIDYPYLMETHIVSTGRQGTDMILARSDALRELTKRRDAKDVLLKKIEVLHQDTDNWESEWKVESLAIILTHDYTLAPQLTIEEKAQLREIALRVYPS